MSSRSDAHRAALGFLPIADTDALCDRGIHVLDPGSTLISPSVEIAAGTVLYPGAILQSDDRSRISIGARVLVFPGTLLLARAGATIVVGRDCELGPGGVQVSAATDDEAITIDEEVRLMNGCELSGISQLGRGSEILGAVSARSVRLAGGRGGHVWPEPDERGAVLKGSGLAEYISLATGEVISCRPSFAAAPVKRQSSQHLPPG